MQNKQVDNTIRTPTEHPRTKREAKFNICSPPGPHAESIRRSERPPQYNSDISKLSSRSQTCFA